MDKCNNCNEPKLLVNEAYVDGMITEDKKKKKVTHDIISDQNEINE